MLVTAALPSCHAGLRGAYEPKRTFDVRVWTNYSSNSFVFPELSSDDFGMPALQAKPNIGICLGGGGFRASIMSLGWIRALHTAKLLDKMRYMSSCSGASWFNSAFSFADTTLETFLGPYIPPEELAMASLGRREKRGSFGRVTAKASFITGAALIGPWRQREQLTWWDELVGREFLRPYGLDEKQSFFTTEGTRGRVDERIKRLMRGRVPVYVGGKESRPYPIMVSTILREEDPHQFFPFEWTPLYVGAPSLHGTAGARLPMLGGGYVEPLGFNSAPPANESVAAYERAFVAHQSGNATAANTKNTTTSSSTTSISSLWRRARGAGSQTIKARPDWIVPLTGWAGVASGWMSQNSKPQWAITQTLLAQNWFKYWNLWDFGGGRTKFVDGGAVDLQALMPLLRRGVEKIVLCIPIWVEPTDNIKAWSRAQFDVSGLFGVVQSGTNSTIKVADGLYSKMLQVFPSEHWPLFYEKYLALYRAAETPLVRMKLPVLRNDYQGIKGGYEADVLWVLNGRDAEWEARLPPATRVYLEASRRLPIHHLGKFPLTETFRPDAPAELVTMLGQYSAHVMMKAAPIIREMMGEAAG